MLDVTDFVLVAHDENLGAFYFGGAWRRGWPEILGDKEVTRSGVGSGSGKLVRRDKSTLQHLQTRS